jgi:hypothetical protein
MPSPVPRLSAMLLPRSRCQPRRVKNRWTGCSKTVHCRPSSKRFLCVFIKFRMLGGFREADPVCLEKSGPQCLAILLPELATTSNCGVCPSLTWRDGPRAWQTVGVVPCAWRFREAGPMRLAIDMHERTLGKHGFRQTGTPTAESKNRLRTWLKQQWIATRKEQVRHLAGTRSDARAA